MKKLFLILTIAAVSASCTYNSNDPSRRTVDNLAFLNNSILNSTVTAAALVLCETDGSKLDYILSASFDTLVTADAFKNHFDYSASEMTITLTADSTWTFASTGNGVLSFIGTLHMTGRNKDDKSPYLSAEYTGLYDEGNGFTAEFTSPLMKLYWGYVPTYYEGYGYYNQFTLMREGESYLTTYYNAAKLDEFKSTYKGTAVEY